MSPTRRGAMAGGGWDCIWEPGTCGCLGSLFPKLHVRECEASFQSFRAILGVPDGELFL